MKTLLHIVRFGGIYLMGLILYAFMFWGVFIDGWTWLFPAVTHSVVGLMVWTVYGLNHVDKGGD